MAPPANPAVAVEPDRELLAFNAAFGAWAAQATSAYLTTESEGVGGGGGESSLAKMSVDDNLQAMELFWADLSQNPESIGELTAFTGC